MTQTEQDNVLIAEFMGYKHFPSEADFPEGYWDLSQNSLPMLPEDFCYNDSWNWLMTVVEKIEYYIDARLRREVIIKRASCHMICIDYEPILKVGATKIEATFKCALAFIEFYNLKK